MVDVHRDIQSLISDDRPCDLVFGSPNLAVRPQLEQLQHDLLAMAKDRDLALATLAGLWLHHDFFDESHNISQDLDTPEGSYWHAILHRREPDYWNAKYWFRRVPRHPIHTELCRDVTALAEDAGERYRLRQMSWDSGAFVDLCEKAASGPESLALLCRRIQRRESELLLLFCLQRATG